MVNSVVKMFPEWTVILNFISLQVQALTDEAKLDSFEGSGSEILLSDDEDFEGLLSASGMWLFFIL